MHWKTPVVIGCCCAWLAQIHSPFCPMAKGADPQDNFGDMPTHAVLASGTTSGTIFSTSTVGGVMTFTGPLLTASPAVFDWVNGTYHEVSAPEIIRKEQA